MSTATDATPAGRTSSASIADTRLRTAVLVGVNLLGLLAFLWPFVLPLAPGLDENHRADGPVILATLLICLGAVLFVELGRGGLGPKAVALLGVLAAAMVALRLPGFVAGFSAMFIVVLLAGNSFGPGFGFLLGAVGTFASGLFIGGLGPWLPFQMVAVGWVGLGAGLLPRSGVATPCHRARGLRVRGRLPVRRRHEPVVLAVPHGCLVAGVGPVRVGVDEPPPLRDLLPGDVVRLGHVPRGRQRRPRSGPGSAGPRGPRPGGPPDAPRRLGPS